MEEPDPEPRATYTVRIFLISPPNVTEKQEIHASDESKARFFFTRLFAHLMVAHDLRPSELVIEEIIAKSDLSDERGLDAAIA